EFNNPKWQINNSINTKEKLVKLIPDRFENISENLFNKFSITPYFWCLINHNENDSDPLAKQIIPDERENIKNSFLDIDPFSEQSKSPEKQLIKRYSDRVLVVTSNICPSYCRYCTRKWNWDKGQTIADKELIKIVEYLKENKNIREVIISGGEPFLLSVAFLERIIQNIITIPTIEVIRVATRILSFLPQKITKNLTLMLKKYRPIWIVTHFNHPNEITPETVNAVNKLLDAGVSIVNQSVLLKGVNEDFETLKRLFYDLTTLGIKPYYLFNCDLVSGTHHFRADFDIGLKIIEDLRGNVGGICIPNLIVDLPHGGKVPILPDYIIEKNKTNLKLKNYQGKIFDYPLG
ncbi:MAG TPA: KamA family radical SAM protein, partial [Spirochaetota bacterium]|nr:KamA family radical SAM protein [Spirochaetota bacterium]